MLAVIDVAEFTVKLLTSTPGKLSVVTPCCQFVLMPLICTAGRLLPWPPVLGETLFTTAGPGLT